MKHEDSKQVLSNSLANLSELHNADIYIYSYTIEDEYADLLINKIRFNSIRRENCILILTTYGGSPDAAYRIARTIKRHYAKFSLYVYGTCKSAGTLLALAADEIVMSEMGEFGPIDIQLTKDDEMLNTSGLSYIQSLVSLNRQMFEAFEKNFLNIKDRSQGSITTKTAAEISSKLAIGLICPISEHIDPVKLGEVYRAMAIADKYGSRLTANKALYTKLIHEYPSHRFVIDCEEANEIFESVRNVESEDELNLEVYLQSVVRHPCPDPCIENALEVFKLAPLDDNESNSTKTVDTEKLNDDCSNDKSSKNGSTRTATASAI